MIEGQPRIALGGAGLREALAKVYGPEGICCDLQLSSGELAALRTIVTESWLSTIGKTAPDFLREFEKLGIENYHKLAHRVDHARIWTTHTRTFERTHVDIIRSFRMFEMFEHEFPESQISSAMPPYGDLGRPRINWRLVRPGDHTDIGPIHADYWFDAVLDGWRNQPGPLVKLKIWIPIFLEEGITGFAFVAGSHLRDYPFRRIRVGEGVFKPDLSEGDLDKPLQTLLTPPGTAVMFNYNVVHRGANSDRATRTRVSMELAINLPRYRLEERYGNVGRYH